MITEVLLDLFKITLLISQGAFIDSLGLCH